MTWNASLARRWQIAVPMPPMAAVTYATFWAIAVSLGECVCTLAFGRRCQRHATSGSLVHDVSTLAFDRQCHTHATSDAEAGNALLRAALGHLVQQRDEDARARRADRVADGDRATVDVDLARVPAHFLVHRAGL